MEGWDEAEHLRIVKAMHSISVSEKKKLYMRHYNLENKNRYRGMVPFLDNDVSHKEFFDMGYPWEWTSDEQRVYPLIEKTPFPES